MTNPYKHDQGDPAELSMEEILKSIRTIITEDKMKQAAEPAPIFKHESTTNPSGARPLDPLPLFSKQDDFSIPDSFGGRESIFPQSDTPYRTNIPILDELKHSEYSLREPLNQASERESVAEKVRSHLHEPLSSHEYAPSQSHFSTQNQTPSFSNQNLGESKTSEVLKVLIDQAVSNRLQHWIDANLPRLVEQALTKELEKVLRLLQI